MKQLFLALTTVLITASAWAQSPFQFNFQAVARNLAGNPLTNQSVDFRLSVLQGAMDGTAVYVEEQPATTNNFGLANLLVGSGTPSLGSLSTVDWANGPYFLQIELDIQNGEGYQLMGTSALASVPYALHAKTSEQAGPEGPQGEPGEQGPAGEQGEAGAGVSQVEIINDSLWLTLTTGEIQNAGRVVPALDSLMGSAGATGNSCDPRFPLGRSGETIFYNAGYGDYTVPAGMCLVVNHVYGSEAFFFINGKKLLYGDYNYEDGDQSRFTSSIIAGEGDIIGSPNSDLNFSGLLAPMSTNVVPVTESLNTTDYTVPEGMLFVWLQGAGGFKVNGVFILKTDVHSSRGQPLILDAGDVISRVPGATAPEDGTINGYLVEEGFFDSCDSAATSAGANGQSAYELWLSLGNEGTEEDFLASLVGPQGEPGPPSDSAQERLHIEFAGDAPTNVWSAVSDTYAVSAGEYYRLNANTPYTYVSGGSCTVIWFRLWDVDTQQVLDISAVREHFIYNSGSEQIQLYNPPVPLHTLGVCGAANTFQLEQFQEFYLQAHQDANVELQWRTQSAQVFSWPEAVKVRGTLSKGW